MKDGNLTLPAGRMLLNDSKKGPSQVQYRRPYGCAVLAMSDVLQTISELKEEKDFVLKVYTYVSTCRDRNPNTNTHTERSPNIHTPTENLTHTQTQKT